jgi:hypothetical protein
MFKVEPLVEDPKPAAPTEADVAASEDTTLLRAWWNAHQSLRPAIEARVNELKAAADEQPGGEQA